ncbi:MAG TPA: hypothetical protein H9813_07395 [Candidatus Fournierella merdipullorum]|uniref:GLUG domain-containing protein n=1 Tax=Candidatus Allofournierella merdipullorum TaxID=2838595 RepID=A0A9D2E4F3_9FIRM|nr:hypothetical protein [Candidatus Fournierella merdipullorum]
MKNARTAAFGALFRRAAALLFLLALSALAACPAFADAASTVWVDGVEITASGAELPAGVTWDGSVLTLNNANLTRTHFDSRDFREAAILANGDLIIRLTGTNTISVANGTYRLDGICAAGVVTIEGDGSLDVLASGTETCTYDVSAFSTTFTPGEAGLVINSGTVTLSATAPQGRGFHIDMSGAPRYLRVNGGSLTLTGSLVASYLAPDISNYGSAAVTASLDVSGTPTTDYTPFAPSQGRYKYLKVGATQYDENGFAEGGHFQPAVLAADGVYEISNAGQLFWFGQKVAEAEANATLNARLTTDITIPAGREWTPIAAGKYGVPYTGTFNGQSYAITGLTVSAASTMNVSSGLVKTLGAGGVVKNLTLRNASIVPPSGYAGAVCGANYGTIENCFAEGGQIGVTAMYGGGVTGENAGTILCCGSSATVNSASGNTIGGIAGINSGTIQNCWNTGAVTGGWYVGGIAGEAATGSSIANCYNTGAVASTLPGFESTAGGIAGAVFSLPQNSYYLASSATGDGGRTQAQFASGEVAWLLNGGTTPTVPAVWGQTLSGDGAEALPALGGAQVYKGWEACWSAAETFGNDPDKLHAVKPAHDFSLLQKDEADHWYACANAGCTAIDRKAAHTFGAYAPDDNATCTDDGTETALCTVCGASHTRTIAGSALGHTGGTATCSEKALCTRCGQPYGELDSSNHAGGRVTRNAVAVGCTSDGYTGDVCCAGCGAVLEQGAVIAAGHQFRDGVCLVCGAQQSPLSGALEAAGLPVTGDESRLVAWTLLLTAAGSGLILCAWVQRRAKAKDTSSED